MNKVKYLIASAIVILMIVFANKVQASTGKVDTETITTSFVGYSPSINPKFTIVVVSPDISHNNNNITYQSLVTKRITASMVNKYYELNN